jgi:Domain of unknown function (DUF5060)
VRHGVATLWIAACYGAVFVGGMQTVKHSNTRWLGSAAVALAAGLAGCGGAQDYTSGGQQGINGDISSGYNGSLSTKYRSAAGSGGVGLDRGAYPTIETSFQLKNLPGDPFDYEKVNVQVSIKKADGATVQVPAFYDGADTWRVRFTPTMPGPYGVVDVKLNGAIVREAKLEKKDWTVSGTPKPGFVRIDKGSHSEFVLDNGSRFYPIGRNIGWESKDTSYSSLFEKMKANGENWSRLWMDQRDGKLLEASLKDGKAVPGEIDLDLARKWDAIFAAADKNDIYFQLVLEHSAAYASATGFADSSGIHPGWDKNPLNASKGGFLKSPDSFFVDPTARALEKRKLYYILARWGASPALMGIELFHDVQNTDAAYGKKWDDIAMWHREMSIFERSNDPYHHLLTTSSAPGISLDSPVWETVDYVQASAYSQDLVGAISRALTTSARKVDRPAMIAEFGPTDSNSVQSGQVKAGVWTGLIAGGSGAAQFWDWENADKFGISDTLKSAAMFAAAAGLSSHSSAPSMPLELTCSQKGTLVLTPSGEGRGASSNTEFVVGSEGAAGFEKLSPVILPKASPIKLQLNCEKASPVNVSIAEVAAGGSSLRVSVDGASHVQEFKATSAPHAVTGKEAEISVNVPAGAHTVLIENIGTDWIRLNSISIADYAPALAGYVRNGKDFAAAYIYNRNYLAGAKSTLPAAGSAKITGLQKGKYRATWWDTATGKALDSTEIESAGIKSDVTLATPPITTDAALYIVKAGTPAATAKVKGGKGRVSKASLDEKDTKTGNGSATSAAPPPSAPNQ